MTSNTAKISLALAWLTALAGAAGSLFFSLVMQLPPCDLCWYQRIFMYPLVFVLATGIVLKDKRVALYALPLAIVGGLIALYHNLLYYGVIPHELAPCQSGASCTEKLLQVFGFIDIPLMSLIGFTVIIVALFVYRRATQKLPNELPNELDD